MCFRYGQKSLGLNRRRRSTSVELLGMARLRRRTYSCQAEAVQVRAWDDSWALEEKETGKGLTSSRRRRVFTTEWFQNESICILLRSCMVYAEGGTVNWHLSMISLNFSKCIASLESRNILPIEGMKTLYDTKWFLRRCLKKFTASLLHIFR